MIIFGICISHDASICVVEDGEIVFYCEEERLSHQKNHSYDVSRSFLKAIERYQPDHVVFTYARPEKLDVDEMLKPYHHLIKKDFQVWNMHNHHDAHAYIAYLNSGFDECGVLVIDGAGDSYEIDNEIWRECETIYSVKPYNQYEVLHKNLFLGSDDISFGKIFNKVGRYLFYKGLQAGKVMGLSAYGSDDPNDPKAFVDGRPSQHFLDSMPNMKNENIAYRVQHDSFEPTCDLISQTIEMSGSRNICLVGGYFLNCVNNYKYIKRFPGIKFYVEPNSSDAGTSIGVARWLWHHLTGDKTKRPLDTLYLGTDANYDRDLLNGEKEYAVTPRQVAELIAEKNVVALYQGKSESGPRALGNRSILYDPRDPKGRDVVNTIKKREYFRPFAGSVLEECATEWFDMATLESSPYMMFATPSLPEKKHLVPALQHNDGTSRIQTVNASQNLNYYNLILEFYEITGVPMVLNTSFNLAGDTLVDNMQDALRTCREAKIPYLYCPERKMMIEFANES